MGHHNQRTYDIQEYKDMIENIKACNELACNHVICVGETLEEKEAGKTNESIANALNTLKGGELDWSRIHIVYQPIWALNGSGKVARLDEVEDTHSFIRAWFLQNISEKVSKDIKILYGGIANEKNAKLLI